MNGVLWDLTLLDITMRGIMLLLYCGMLHWWTFHAHDDDNNDDDGYDDGGGGDDDDDDDDDLQSMNMSLLQQHAHCAFEKTERGKNQSKCCQCRV